MAREGWVHGVCCAAVVCLLSGCAHGPATYRLAEDHVLMPPGVTVPELPEAKLVVPVTKWIPDCAPEGNAITVKTRGSKKVELTVRRDVLLKQPVGWLSGWAMEAEAKGCLPPRSSVDVALRIVEALPLDPRRVHGLLYADNVIKGYIDLGPHNELKVVSPVGRGVTPDAPIAGITPAAGNNINVTLAAEADSIGYETAWYAFQPKSGGGTTIQPILAERTIAGKKEAEPAPATNWFAFPPQAAFYRMFYKTDPADNGITEILVGGATPGELEQLTHAMMGDNATCEKARAAMCVMIPRRVAVNPYLHVAVNGADIRLSLGSTIRSAITAAGGRPDLAAVPNLAILKPYGGKMTPVIFQPGAAAIFDVALLGGESITWTAAPATR